mgnify:CR=1 FL=1
MEHIVLWGAVLIIALIAEFLTAALVSIWFVPSAAVCILLELCGVRSLGIQAAVFVVLSALLAFILRKKTAESLRKDETKTNVDALIGQNAVVEEDIPSGGVGRVRVGGMSWAAFTEADRTVLRGENVKIQSVSGVRLLCIPKEEKMPDDGIIGKKARVETAIDNFSASGSILCNGCTYRAASETDAVIKSDAVVTIVACRDGKAICRPDTIKTTEHKEESVWKS